MNPVSERFLDSFDHLPPTVQWQVASAILRRTTTFDFPPLTDDDLVINAEMLFLSLDTREADDEQAAHEQVLVEQLLNPNLHQRQLQSASVTALLNLTPFA